jgi:hypothetical protein
MIAAGVISVEGEMSGRTEGGATERRLSIYFKGAL